MEQAQKPSLEETLEWLSKKITGQFPIVTMRDDSHESGVLIWKKETSYALDFNRNNFSLTNRETTYTEMGTQHGEKKNLDYSESISQISGDLADFDYSDIDLADSEDSYFDYFITFSGSIIPCKIVYLNLHCYAGMPSVEVSITEKRNGAASKITNTKEPYLQIMLADRSLAERIARAFEFAIKECGGKQEPW